MQPLCSGWEAGLSLAPAAVEISRWRSNRPHRHRGTWKTSSLAQEATQTPGREFLNGAPNLA